MQGTTSRIPVVLFAALLSGCAAHGAVTKDPMARRVASVVQATTQKAIEAQALIELESLGDDGVPYLVGHLGDERTLPFQQISLVNKAPDAFEGMRHYSPKVVHDALAAVLNQITGKGFEFVYNGATSKEREADRQQWQAWCARAYPEKAAICRGA